MGRHDDHLISNYVDERLDFELKKNDGIEANLEVKDK